MSVFEPDMLDTFFERYGWSFQKSMPGYWESGWSNHERDFKLHVKLCSTFVDFQVNPWIKLDTTSLTPEKLAYLAQALFELNNDVSLVKVCFEKPGTISLHCQVLCAGFDYQSFQLILGILGHYCNSLSSEIVSLVNEMEIEELPALIS